MAKKMKKFYKGKKSMFYGIKEGALHEALHVFPDDKIPLSRMEMAAKSGGHLGKMTRWAMNVRKSGKGK